MSYFSEAIEAKLSDRHVAASLLCFMDFVDTPRRWWMGYGSLVAGGNTWLGLGEWISIDGLEQPIGTSAPKTTFTLSGVDSTIVTLARNSSDRVKDRRVTVYTQFFDVTPDDAGAQPWSNLGTPYAVWSGKMDQMTYAANGPSNRSVTVTAESLWVNRLRPPYGYYTDRDQNARYPGDRGLEQGPSLVSKTVRWPTF